MLARRRRFICIGTCREMRIEDLFDDDDDDDDELRPKIFHKKIIRLQGREDDVERRKAHETKNAKSGNFCLSFLTRTYSFE